MTPPTTRAAPRPARRLWACSECGVVLGDVREVAVSDLLTTTVQRLCAKCIARTRLDPFLVVEELEDEDHAAASRTSRDRRHSPDSGIRSRSRR